MIGVTSFLVGGGSAGAVLAARLSEDGRHAVLLLEAGGLPSRLAHVPALAAFAQDTQLDWQYYTEPQQRGTKSLKGRVRAYRPSKDVGQFRHQLYTEF